MVYPVSYTVPIARLITNVVPASKAVREISSNDDFAPSPRGPQPNRTSNFSASTEIAKTLEINSDAQASALTFREVSEHGGLLVEERNCNVGTILGKMVRLGQEWCLFIVIVSSKVLIYRGSSS